MTTEIANLSKVATPDDAARITTSWPDLLRRPVADRAERDELVAYVEHLKRPAPRDWTLARIAALLSGYYAADVPQEIVRIEAEDWAHALREFPAWAIVNAVRWWKGEDNPRRRNKPHEGDIAERARKEMAAIVVAEVAVKRFDRGGNILPFKPEPREELTPEERQRRADEIMAAAGFAVKRFGGEAAECS